ncbi:MAG: Thermophilic serine proteinase precursor [Syntrophorhabdaceae bacterium PtaU1.Bin034]|nr:MAG: Thermophilic serine proteinase precursor [Syntrophorhabdaceae bacterium PtaU1.Bin034]
MKGLAVLLMMVLFLVPFHTVLAGGTFSNIQSRSVQNLPAYIPGEVLVKYRSTVPSGARTAHIMQVGATGIKTVGQTGIERVKLPEGMTLENGLKLFEQDSRVEQVAPNGIRRPYATPNDEYYGQLWGLNNTGQKINNPEYPYAGTAGADMKMPAAWDLQKGSNSVVVAVLDTGVDYRQTPGRGHPDLQANIWKNPGETSCTNGIDDDGNGYIDDCYGWDFVLDTNDPADCGGHGTHVAGTIGAVGNNGIGITGVNWNVRIMPLRGLGLGDGNDADMIEAIDYARRNGARIINASWGGPVDSGPLKSAIEAFTAAGGLFVAAAGNDGVDIDSAPQYPGAWQIDGMITVAASDQDDGLASFSNYGLTSVHVAAPGVSIYSTVPPTDPKLITDFEGTTLPAGWSSGGADNRWTVADSLLLDSLSGHATGTNSWVTTPGVDLSGLTGCRAGYEIRYDLASGDNVYLRVSKDKNDWTALPAKTYSGSTCSGGVCHLVSEEVDLSAYDGAPQLYLRLHLAASHSSAKATVAFDNFEVICAPKDHSGALPLYAYYDGTSMATPHVAGVAALLKAADAGLTNVQIKQRLVDTVDTKSGLLAFVSSGGRINARMALVGPLAVPANLAAKHGSNRHIDLSWTDTAGNETGFLIERALAPGGPFDYQKEVGPDTTTFTDGDLKGGTAYYYRVKTVIGDLASRPSNVASDTTAPDPTRNLETSGHGCFIATAAFGSPLANEVLVLRNFRDAHLLTNTVGRRLVLLYYRLSPPVADYISRHDTLRAATRTALIPVVYSVKYPAGAVFLLLFAAGMGISVFVRSRH